MNKGLLIATALSLMILVPGCSSDLRTETVTTYNVSNIRSDVQNSSDLSDADKASFSGALARSDFQPYGKTVTEIIKEQNAHATALAQQAAKEQRELDKDLGLYPVSISIKKGNIAGLDDPTEDIDTFTFSVTNSGSKNVQSFSATITLATKGGGTLYTGTLEDATGIASGKTEMIEVRATIDDLMARPNPQLVRVTPISDTILNYTVEKIRYDDGTQVSRESDF